MLLSPGLYKKIIELDFNSMYTNELLNLFPIICHNKTQKDSIQIPGFHYVEFTSNIETPILPVTLDTVQYINGSFAGLY
jgi:DNA polymerase elongation subunit (family B)